ncbi:hypothetical protein VNO77_41941 [Canavalia gladiata]|uniref:DEAD/DEAH-box helicase domain-containing protein n=1 Tax=Canavalia gladiata TaxID=3824 RepID=A0AAN9K1G5_CANGL
MFLKITSLTKLMGGKRLKILQDLSYGVEHRDLEVFLKKKVDSSLEFLLLVSDKLWDVVPNGEVVVAKKIRTKYYSWKECINLREAKTLERMKHPNSVKLKVIKENVILGATLPCISNKEEKIRVVARETNGEVQADVNCVINSGYFSSCMPVAADTRDCIRLVFQHPSKVQHECIPQAILGMDVICQAKSGMGKTIVFVLSTLQQIDPAPDPISMLVFCIQEN